MLGSSFPAGNGDGEGNRLTDEEKCIPTIEKYNILRLGLAAAVKLLHECTCRSIFVRYSRRACAVSGTRC